MRIMFVIPHYFGAGPDCYGSTDTSQRERRIFSLRKCITSLHQQFGRSQKLLMHGGQSRVVNQMTANDLDIVVCVRGGDHLLDNLKLPEGSFMVHVSDIENPRYLGYVCHDVLRESSGSYDWYCFLEDDIVISDPMFFCKLSLFYSSVADPDYLLQPNRYELGSYPECGKAYIDGPLWEDSAGFLATLRLPGCRDEIQVTFGGSLFRMVPAENPHAGCFFLMSHHLQHLIEQPWYGERVIGYAGPLESAATMYIMTLFHLFKPADECASFLEVHHHYQKYLKDQSDDNR